jgi:hypothetical protein
MHHSSHPRCVKYICIEIHMIGADDMIGDELRWRVWLSTHLSWRRTQQERTASRGECREDDRRAFTMSSVLTHHVA